MELPSMIVIGIPTAYPVDFENTIMSFTRRPVWLDPVTGMNWTPPLAVLSVSRLAWPGGVTIVEFVVQRIRNVVVISAWGAETFEIWKTQFDAVSSRFTPIVVELTVMVPVIPMDRWGMHQNGMEPATSKNTRNFAVVPGSRS